MLAMLQADCVKEGAFERKKFRKLGGAFERKKFRKLAQRNLNDNIEQRGYRGKALALRTCSAAKRRQH